MAFDSNARPQSVQSLNAARKRASAFGALRTQTLLRKLEPRIMFDGAALATATDALHHDAAADASHSALSAADIAGFALHTPGPVAVQVAAHATQIVFIDAKVQDPAAIEKAAGSGDTIVLLDASQDGLTQIAQYLAGHTGLDAIHIVSHGEAGKLFLGSSVYDNATIKGFDAELAAIGASLHQGGDILLYGCDVAQGAAGDALVHKIADLTRANVAASTDLTGAAAGGGNWVLEDQVGAVHTSAIAAMQWNGELGAAASNGKGALLSATGNGIYSIDIASGKGTLVTTVPGSVGGVATSGSINSFAVDQPDGLIYYCNNAASSTNTALFAYDFVHDKHILINADMTNNGAGKSLTVGGFGLGTAGATFNNGILYLAVENNMNGGTTDSIYTITFTGNGTNVALVSRLNTNLPASNDWGDLGFDVANNVLLSFSGAMTRLDPVTGAQIGSVLALPAGSGYQGSQDVAGDVYTVGNSIQQIDPITGAAVGPSVLVTSDGSTALGASNDAGGWTPPTATIGGQIYWDNNGNKTFDTGDLAAASVTVRLYSDINNDGVVNGNDALLATDTTDAGGQYHFTGVLPGDYIVKVTDANGVIGTHAYSTAGGAVNTSGHVAIIGSTISNIDFGIANTVTAMNDTFATYDNTPVTISVTANDSDAQHDAFSITAVNGTAFSALTTDIAVTGGSVALDASGNLVFTPLTGYNGSPTFTYTVTDVHGATATATVGGTVSYAPPAAVNDTFTTNASAAVTIAATANDTDVNGFPLTITKIGATAITAGGAAVAVTDGSVKLDAAGDLVFTPTANFTGAVPSFTYTVSDGHGNTATATVTGTVVDVPPVAHDDTFTTTQGQAVAIPELANDSSPVGLPLTVTKINAATITAGGAAVTIDHGTVSESAAGVFTYTPTAGYNGPEAFTYTISDGHGGAATANVTGTVYAPPVAVNDTFSTGLNMPVTIPVQANDSDVNGFPLTITKVNATAITAGGSGVAVTGGVVTLDGSSNLVFTPTAGYSGAPSFTYTIDDTHHGASTATVSGQVYAPPVATPDSASGTAHAPINVNVLANDAGGGGTLDPASVQITGTAHPGDSLTVAGEGSWSVNATTGAITFTPLAAFNGAPTPITYRVADNSGARSNAATVTVMPLATDPHLDLSGQAPWTGAFLYSHGSSTLANASWASPAGLARFTTVGPEVAGSGLTLGYSSQSHLDVSGIGSTSLSGAISGGDFISMSFTTTPGMPETWIQNTVTRNTGYTGAFALAISTDGFKSAALLSKDVPGTNYAGPFYGNGDYPWQPATDYQLQPGASYEIRVYLYNPPGTVSPSSTAVWDDFYVFYSNDPVNYASTFIEAGAPAPIADPTVIIEDTNDATMASSLVTLTNKQASDQFLVSGSAVSNGGSGSIGSIHYAVTDANGQISIALSGTASLSAYQSALKAITFQNTSAQPDTSDRIINVTVNDGNHDSNVATTTIHVIPINDAPAGADHVAVTNQDAAYTFKAADFGFSDVNGDALLGVKVTTLPPSTDGQLLLSGAPVHAGDTISAASIAKLAFAPAAGVYGSGLGSFTFQVQDTGGAANGGQDADQSPNAFSFNVNGAPQITVSLGDKSGLDGNAITIITKGAFADPEGGTLTFSSGNLPAWMSIDPASGKITGTLPSDASVNGAAHDGVYAIDVTATDPAGLSVTQSFNFSAHNVAPVAVNDGVYTTNEDTSTTFDVLANDHDGGLDHDTLSIAQIDGHPIVAGGAAVQVANGQVTLGTDGKLTFHPAQDFNGPATFHYTIADGQGGSATASVQVDVTPVNDAPVAANTALTTLEDTPVTITTASLGFADPNDQPANALKDVIIGTVPATGTLALNGVAVKAGDVITAAGIANGLLVYTPAANANGPGLASFSFQVQDNGGTANGGVDTSVVHSKLAFNVTAVNDAPTETLPLTSPSIAAGVPLKISGISVADIDANGLPETVTVTAAHGTLVFGSTSGLVLAPGSSPASQTVAGTLSNLNAALSHLMYTSNAGFAGLDKVSVTINDNGNTGIGGPLTAAQSLPITVWAPPGLQPDGFKTIAGNPVTISPLANDSDPNGFRLAITAVDGHAIIAGGPAVPVQGGSVTLDAAGGLTFVSAPGYSGAPVFTYTVGDGHGGFSTATVSGQVAAALNLTQYLSGAGQPKEYGDAAGPHKSVAGDDGGANEYIHKIASGTSADVGASSISQHIHYVVGGATAALDSQYGAGGQGVGRSLYSNHEADSGGAAADEPLAELSFWNHLATVTLALGEPVAGDATVAAWMDGEATPFSQQIALVRGQFDREALRFGADLADAA